MVRPYLLEQSLGLRCICQICIFGRDKHPFLPRYADPLCDHLLDGFVQQSRAPPPPSLGSSWIPGGFTHCGCTCSGFHQSWSCFRCTTLQLTEVQVEEARPSRGILGNGISCRQNTFSCADGTLGSWPLTEAAIHGWMLGWMFHGIKGTAALIAILSPPSSFYSAEGSLSGSTITQLSQLSHVLIAAPSLGLPPFPSTFSEFFMTFPVEASFHLSYLIFLSCFQLAALLICMPLNRLGFPKSRTVFN